MLIIFIVGLTVIRRGSFRAGTSTAGRSRPFADETVAVGADAVGAPSGAVCGHPSAVFVPRVLG